MISASAMSYCRPNSEKTAMAGGLCGDSSSGIGPAARRRLCTDRRRSAFWRQPSCRWMAANNVSHRAYTDEPVPGGSTEDELAPRIGSHVRRRRRPSCAGGHGVLLRAEPGGLRPGEPQQSYPSRSGRWLVSAKLRGNELRVRSDRAGERVSARWRRGCKTSMSTHGNSGAGPELSDPPTR